MTKIAVFINAVNGCVLHRLLIPYLKMAQMVDEKDYYIDFLVPKKEDTIDTIINKVSEYDYFIFNRLINITLLKRIKAELPNLKVINDNDDDWILGKQHPLYMHYLLNGISDLIKYCLEMSDAVFTTTEYLANRIRTVNKNVFVIPNALCAEGQFAKDNSKTPRLRFGLIGSSSHTDDMKLLDGIIKQINYYDKTLLDKIQFVLCGFDGGKANVYDPKTNKLLRIEEMSPKETCWGEWERNLTDNYSTVTPYYRDYLIQFVKDDMMVLEEPYVRCWTKDIFSYAHLYDNIDVLLIPLLDNDFNKSKSPLKLVEASVKGKAVICSNVDPYKDWLRNGENCIAINRRKGIIAWVEAIAKLVREPQYLEKIRTGLADIAKEGAVFNLEKVTKDRIEIFNVELPKILNK